MAKESGFNFQQRQEIFLSSTVSRLTLGPIQLLGHEADDLPPSSAEVKNMDYTFTPPYIFMAWCLIKQSNNFTFHK
jgi:hypothetical protein